MVRIVVAIVAVLAAGPAFAASYCPTGFVSMASTSVVAHALATSDRYFSFTLETQPALVTKLPRFQVLSFFKSTSCSGCCSAFKTQTGVSARTVALSWSRLSEQIFRFDKWSLCPG